MIPHFPKPSQAKKHKACYEITRDGRLIIDLTTRAGREMRDEITGKAWSRDDGICGICGKYVCLLEAVGDHIKPRGMGGGFRDDRLENIQAVHPLCNSEKGSKRNFTISDELIP